MTRPAAGKPAARRSEQALEHVLDLVRKGKLAPGARLPSERALAEEIGVSRPMLREALNTLEAMGYLDRRSKSGNFLLTAIPHAVTDPIDRGLDARLLPFADVIELRRALEGWAVEKAAAGGGRAELERLRACVEAMEAAGELRDDAEAERYREADLEFHRVLARMTGNLVYVHLFDFFAQLVRRSVQLSRTVVRGRFTDENIARHRAVLEALEARDPRRARAAMDAHFSLVEKHLRPR